MEIDCTSPKTYTGLAVGDHVFAVRATDAAGNVQAEWTEWEWTITPAVAPATTLTEAPSGTTTSTAATLAFSANEAATFECSLDAADFAACTSPVSLTGLAAGSHTFRVAPSTWPGTSTPHRPPRRGR